MLKKDKRVPIGFLRGDATDKDIEEFVAMLNAAVAAPNKKPARGGENGGGRQGKSKKPAKK